MGDHLAEGVCAVESKEGILMSIADGLRLNKSSISASFLSTSHHGSERVAASYTFCHG